MRKGTHHTAATRARHSSSARAARARRTALERIAAGEVIEALRNGTVATNRRRYVRNALELPLRLLLALGGDEAVSEQQRILIVNAGRTEIVIALLMVRFLQAEGDLELASKINGLIAQQRATLQALGLERFEREVPDLRSYLASRTQAAPSATTSAARDPRVEPATNAAETREEAAS